MCFKHILLYFIFYFFPSLYVFCLHSAKISVTKHQAKENQIVVKRKTSVLNGREMCWLSVTVGLCGTQRCFRQSEWTKGNCSQLLQLQEHWIESLTRMPHIDDSVVEFLNDPFQHNDKCQSMKTLWYLNEVCRIYSLGHPSLVLNWSIVVQLPTHFLPLLPGNQSWGKMIWGTRKWA